MIGVMSSVDAVIKSIVGLSASSGDLSALHDLLKGAEDSLRADPDVKISTLDQLDPSKHSLGYLYFLDVLTSGPVSKEKASDVVPMIARFISSCDAAQIRVASDKFVTLCKRLKDHVLELKDPVRGVGPLSTAVQKLQVSSKRLTALHPDFLQLCLQAKFCGFSIDILENLRQSQEDVFRETRDRLHVLEGGFQNLAAEIRQDREVMLQYMHRQDQMLRTIGLSKNILAMDESLSCDPLFLSKVGRERQRYDFGDDFDTVPQKFSM